MNHFAIFGLLNVLETEAIWPLLCIVYTIQRWPLIHVVTLKKEPRKWTPGQNDEFGFKFLLITLWMYDVSIPSFIVYLSSQRYGQRTSVSSKPVSTPSQVDLKGQMICTILLRQHCYFCGIFQTLWCPCLWAPQCLPTRPSEGRDQNKEHVE